MGPYLEHIGVPENEILRTLSVAQVLEIVALFSLGRLLKRFGYAKLMALGATMHVARFALLAFTDSYWGAVAGSACHGASYALFFALAMLCFDRLCPPALRAGAFLLFMIFIAGFGGLTAVFLGGLLLDSGVSYFYFWLLPMVIGLVVQAVMLMQLRLKTDRFRIAPEQAA